MKHIINDWIITIKNARISAIKALEVYKTVLLPKLDLGLTFACISKKIRNIWSRRIIRTILACDYLPSILATSLSVEAFSDLVDSPLIGERYWGNRLKDLIYNLNAKWTYAGLSTHSRLGSLTNKEQSNHLNLYEKRLTKKYALSRYAATIEFFRINDVKLVNPAPGIGQIYSHVKYITKELRGQNDLSIFTDGSTMKNRPYSGVGICVQDNLGNPLLEYGFPVLTYGNNLHAELAGLLVAFWIGSEAKSVISLRTLNHP